MFHFPHKPHTQEPFKSESSWPWLCTFAGITVHNTQETQTQGWIGVPKKRHITVCPGPLFLVPVILFIKDSSPATSLLSPMSIRVMSIVFLNSLSLWSISNSIMRTFSVGEDLCLLIHYFPFVQEDKKSKDGILVSFVTPILLSWPQTFCIIHIISFRLAFD